MFSTHSTLSRKLLAPIYMTLPYCRSWLIGSTCCGNMFRQATTKSMITPYCRTATPPTMMMMNTSTQRWMGSKPGSDSSTRGEIIVRNEQTVLTDIDEDLLRTTLDRIRDEIGYETYDVSLVLIDDAKMQELNHEFRGVDAPTDILSFHLHLPIEPGVLEPPEFDIPDYYDLGEIFIDVPYVIRRMEEDRIENEKNPPTGPIEDKDDPEYEFVEEGVSAHMSTVYDPEFRIHLLLIHGMLHLVGYDHETDEDCDLMTAREEEIMEKVGFLVDESDDDED